METQDNTAEGKPLTEGEISLNELSQNSSDAAQSSMQLKDMVDEETYTWLLQHNSIPGARAPILYTGSNLIRDFYMDILGRPMKLVEAQIIVQPDGSQVTCGYTNSIFQPVKYIYALPRDLQSLRRQLEEGTPLEKLKFPTGGSYYTDKKTDEPVPISGAVYYDNRRTNTYDRDFNSPLVKLGRILDKWATTLENASRYKQRRLKREEDDRMLEKLASRLK